MSSFNQAYAWSMDAWGRHVGSPGLTVPADGLAVLLARLEFLEGLALASGQNMKVTVETTNPGALNEENPGPPLG